MTISLVTRRNPRNLTGSGAPNLMSCPPHITGNPHPCPATTCHPGTVTTSIPSTQTQGDPCCLTSRVVHHLPRPLDVLSPATPRTLHTPTGECLPSPPQIYSEVCGFSRPNMPAALTGHNVGASPSTPGHRAVRTAPSAGHCRGHRPPPSPRSAGGTTITRRQRNGRHARSLPPPPTVDPYPKGVRRAVTPNEQQGGVPWVTRRANDRPRTAQLAS